MNDWLMRRLNMVVGQVVIESSYYSVLFLLLLYGLVRGEDGVEQEGRRGK